MRRIIKIIINIAAVAAATLALAFGTATTASAASDTPDNEWVNGWGGMVMWNDYDNEYHDNDLDNVWVEDEWGDGYSVELNVYRDGDLVDSTHAYNGEEARVSFGNVPNGEGVYWETCLWDDGEPVTDEYGPLCTGDWFWE